MAGALTAAIAAAFSGGAAAATDPYFEYTTLLLPGSGTNGAQNNTFLDGSTNNFTITRNGNTTQGTFSPFSQTGWGNYFGGSGNYLKVADGTALDLPGDFTLEGWFYFSSLSSNNGIIGYGSEAASQNGFSLYWAASSVNKLRIYSNGATLLTGTTTLSANTWNHIAIVRSGSGSNNLTVYVNGAVDQTATNTTSFTGVAALGMGIGVNYDGTFYNPFTGYASNIRLVKGQALATGAFTPPTSPVSTSSVGWTGANAAASLTGTVSVLTCQSNRFVDNSSSPLAITVTGSPSVQAFSPFNPSASWSAATYGGSGYFDGSGDYLSVPTTTSLSFGTSDFTIEAWIYRTGNNGGEDWTIIDGRASNSATPWVFGMTSARVPYFYDGVSQRNSSVTVDPFAWTHIAVTRLSGTLKIFVNGVEGYSAANSTNLDRTAGAVVGASVGLTSGLAVGYISNLRVLKGTGYSSVTVPTAPLTAITNTSLLLNFTNAGIYDATSKNDLETVGDAQISNAVTPKWGSTSIKFDGTGDYLQMPDSELVEFGSADFTIEAWVYPTLITGANRVILGHGTSGTQWLAFYIDASGYLTFAAVSSSAVIDRTATSRAVSLNTWTHVAVSRSGSTFRLFIDGSEPTYTGSPSTTSSAMPNFAAPFRIGAQRWDGDSGISQGYIQDMRITKYARYTTNFTPPTAAFPTL